MLQAVHYKIKCDLCSKFCRNTKVLNRHKMKAHVLPADNFTVEITASGIITFTESIFFK